MDTPHLLDKRFSSEGLCTLIALTASPSKLVSVEELMETTKGMTNMALAHEIVMNGNFQIKPTEPAEGR